MFLGTISFEYFFPALYSEVVSAFIYLRQHSKGRYAHFDEPSPAPPSLQILHPLGPRELHLTCKFISGSLAGPMVRLYLGPHIQDQQFHPLPLTSMCNMEYPGAPKYRTEETKHRLSPRCVNLWAAALLSLQRAGMNTPLHCAYYFGKRTKSPGVF